MRVTYYCQKGIAKDTHSTLWVTLIAGKNKSQRKWPGASLLTWTNFDPSTYKQIHSYSMGWNYLSIPKLQRCNRWSSGMDKKFSPTLCWTCDYLSMLGLKLTHVSKMGPWSVLMYIWRNLPAPLTLGSVNKEMKLLRNWRLSAFHARCLTKCVFLTANMFFYIRNKTLIFIFCMRHLDG